MLHETICAFDMDATVVSICVNLTGVSFIEDKSHILYTYVAVGIRLNICIYNIYRYIDAIHNNSIRVNMIQFLLKLVA